MTTTALIQSSAHERARAVVLRYTGIAAATGAVPVPAASAAIVAENAAMINEVAGCFGVPISVSTVVSSLGMAGVVNVLGRALFVEAARLMGWFAGPLGVAGVSALGASTAALQTITLGFLAIAIAENGGAELERRNAQRAIAEARREIEVSQQWNRPGRGGSNSTCPAGARSDGRRHPDQEDP